MKFLIPEEQKILLNTGERVKAADLSQEVSIITWENDKFKAVPAKVKKEIQTGISFSLRSSSWRTIQYVGEIEFLPRDEGLWRNTSEFRFDPNPYSKINNNRILSPNHVPIFGVETIPLDLIEGMVSTANYHPGPLKIPSFIVSLDELHFKYALATLLKHHYSKPTLMRDRLSSHGNGHVTINLESEGYQERLLEVFIKLGIRIMRLEKKDIIMIFSTRQGRRLVANMVGVYSSDARTDNTPKQFVKEVFWERELIGEVPLVSITAEVGNICDGFFLWRPASGHNFRNGRK